jgi:hypothetical protein
MRNDPKKTQRASCASRPAISNVGSKGRSRYTAGWYKKNNIKAHFGPTAGAYGLFGYAFDTTVPYVKAGVRYEGLQVSHSTIPNVPEFAPSACVGSIFRQDGLRTRLDVAYCGDFLGGDKNGWHGTVAQRVEITFVFKTDDLF